MTIYTPHPLEHFGKTVRKMAEIANRKGKKVLAVIDGVKYVAKPGRSHWPLVKHHDKVMLEDYQKNNPRLGQNSGWDFWPSAHTQATA